jgi:hypothetical protein
VGLHTHPRRPDECRASGGPVDECQNREGPRALAGAGPANVVADVSAHALGAIGGADFFTTEVWTWRGLVTSYTRFVIDLASRRVLLGGSTPPPDDLFMRQGGSRADRRG